MGAILLRQDQAQQLLDIESMTQAPILISGCPRSGTTFCGSMISKAPEVFEVYEPFNADFTYHLDMPAKFARLTDDNHAELKPRLDRMYDLGDLSTRVSHLPRAAFDRLRTDKDMAAALALKKLVQDRESFLHASRVSVKDPIAFFSAEWLAETYGSRVVMLCRHPGGIVSSFLKLGWEPETKYIVDHPLPLSVGKFDHEIAEWRANPDDRVGAVLLQWKLFTQATLDLHKLHPDWMFCLHHQLCDHPVEVFKEIFASVGLPFTDDVEKNILAHTGASNFVNPTTHTQHSLKREAAKLKDAWRERLDSETVDRIVRETDALWDEAVATFTMDLTAHS